MKQLLLGTLLSTAAFAQGSVYSPIEGRTIHCNSEHTVGESAHIGQHLFAQVDRNETLIINLLSQDLVCERRAGGAQGGHRENYQWVARDYEKLPFIVEFYDYVGGDTSRAPRIRSVRLNRQDREISYATQSQSSLRTLGAASNYTAGYAQLVTLRISLDDFISAQDERQLNGSGFFYKTLVYRREFFSGGKRINLKFSNENGRIQVRAVQ